MDEELSSKIEEARQTALDVDEGKCSKYWKHLERKIKSWLSAENKRYEVVNKRLLTSDGEVQDRNDILKRITYLNQLLLINEDIIEECLGIVGMTESPVDSFRKRESFVGK